MVSARARRRAATGRSPRCAGCARTSSRWPGCSPRRAARCARSSTPRSPSWPAQPREELEAALLTADRFLRPDGDVAPSAEVRRAPAGPVRAVRDAAGHGADPPGRRQPGGAGRRAARPQRAARPAARPRHAVRRAPRPAQGPVGAAGGAAVLADVPANDGGQLAAEVERIFAGAHEFVELRLLSALRSGARHAARGAGGRGADACSAATAPVPRPGSGCPTTPRRAVAARRRADASWTAGSGGRRTRC